MGQWVHLVSCSKTSTRRVSAPISRVDGALMDTHILSDNTGRAVTEALECVAQQGGVGVSFRIQLEGAYGVPGVRLEHFLHSVGRA